MSTHNSRNSLNQAIISLNYDLIHYNIGISKFVDSFILEIVSKDLTINFKKAKQLLSELQGKYNWDEICGDLDILKDYPENEIKLKDVFTYSEIQDLTYLIIEDVCKKMQERIDLHCKGEIRNPKEMKNWLSVSQVAKKYKLARNSVLVACKTPNRFTEDEAVETSLGWLISPAGSERVFKYRIE